MPSSTDTTAQIDLAVRGRHLPGLDGVRALAIAAVLAFHLGILSTDAPRGLLLTGGFLGVDLFFVLSGFLITSLLLEERAVTGAIALGAFWIRRARRLLPALAAMIIGVMVAAPLAMRVAGTLGTDNLSTIQLRRSGVAALVYVANWYDMLQNASQVRSFLGESPFSHCWSLSIEEQFYLVWPPVTVAIGIAAGRRWRGTGLIVCGLLGTASLMAMALSTPSIVVWVWGYFATTSRAWELLIGAGLAYLTACRPQPGPRLRRALGIASPLCLLGLAWFWWTASTTATWGYRGGFLVYCLLAAVLIADVAQARPSPTARVLSIPPLRGLGRISYGVYLYHWPIFLLLPAFWHLSGAGLDVARVGVTMVVAVTSWFLLERPVLSRRLPRLPGLGVSLAASATAAVALFFATSPSVALGTIANQHVAPPARVDGVPRGAGQLSSSVPFHLPPRAAGPTRILVLGGTPSYDLEPGLAASLGATPGVAMTVAAWQPSDLIAANPEVSRYFLLLQQLDAVAHVRPQVLVIMPSELDASFLLANPATAVNEEAKAFAQLAAQPSVVGVVLAGYPGWLAPAPRGGTAETLWQQAVAQATQLDGRIRSAPVETSLNGADGSFPTWLPPTNDPSAPRSSWVRVQMTNNIGLCPAGQVRYAAALDSDVATLSGLPKPPAGWWRGSWTMASRLLAPPAWCPADSPVHPWRAGHGVVR